MKRIIFFVFFSILFPLISVFPQQSGDNDQWYPFVIPEKLDPNSPLNIGKLVLDPPAGKHGFCKVKDGHFYFEDGTRAKFWGTNLCFSACFPTHKQAEMLAERIAFFGFNAVRLHHMDWGFEPRGIFKDVDPAYRNPQMKRTGVLSEKQLDRLNYLIYQLKLRGVYIDMNLLVSRHFTQADGVVEADKLGMAAKPVSMFDPKLIELQKKYAKDLLSHLNPYTKLRYCDDPAIALVEITNENSLERNTGMNLPAYYFNQLNDKWNIWQQKNHGTRKDFDRMVEKEYFNEMAGFLRREMHVKVPIEGSQYSSKEAQAACDFIDTHAYWDHPQFPRKPWDINDFSIHNKSLLTDPQLGFINRLVGTGNEVKGFGKPFTITEWNHCYPNQYAYETPILLAASANQNDWDALFQFAFSHGWDFEPEFDNIQSYFDIMQNAQKLTLCAYGSYIYLRGHPAAGVTTNYGFASYISPYICAYSGSIRNRRLPVSDITLIPSQDCTLIISGKNGERLSDAQELLVLPIGEIKNTNSGWKNQKFMWGTKPTLLRKIDITIENSTDKTIKLYPTY